MKTNRRNYMKKMLKAVAGGTAIRAGVEVETNEDTSIEEFMGQNTARYVLNPEPHLDPEATENIDLMEFVNHFTHETDEMNGLYDVVRKVHRTIRAGSGDCVDYSAVACSWLLQHTNTHPRIIVYAPIDTNPGHINVYGNGQIYDYKGTYNTTPEEFASSLDSLSLAYKTEPI